MYTLVICLNCLQNTTWIRRGSTVTFSIVGLLRCAAPSSYKYLKGVLDIPQICSHFAFTDHGSTTPTNGTSPAVQVNGKRKMDMSSGTNESITRMNDGEREQPAKKLALTPDLSSQTDSAGPISPVPSLSTSPLPPNAVPSTQLSTPQGNRLVGALHFTPYEHRQNHTAIIFEAALTIAYRTASMELPISSSPSSSSLPLILASSSEYIWKCYVLALNTIRCLAHDTQLAAQLEPVQLEHALVITLHALTSTNWNTRNSGLLGKCLLHSNLIDLSPPPPFPFPLMLVQYLRHL